MSIEENEIVEVKKKKNIFFNGPKKTLYKIIGILVAALMIFVSGICVYAGYSKPKPKPEIITQTSLEKIIKIDEMSTYKSQYNGVAVVKNEKKKDKVDCYVSYEAEVYVGFNMKDVTIKKDAKNKKVVVTMPKVKVQDIDVDMDKMEFIFEKNSANKEGISARAYKECIDDVTKESEKEDALFTLAEENAKNYIKALLQPFVSQVEGYKLVIK